MGGWRQAPWLEQSSNGRADLETASNELLDALPSPESTADEAERGVYGGSPGPPTTSFRSEARHHLMGMEEGEDDEADLRAFFVVARMSPFSRALSRFLRTGFPLIFYISSYPA
jgi:hypothetical protein